MILVLQILLIAAAISIALGVYSAIHCANQSRREDDAILRVSRDPRWGYRR